MEIKGKNGINENPQLLLKLLFIHSNTLLTVITLITLSS